MIRKFHGIDQHKNFSTISVLDLEGKEVYFKSICLDLRSYIDRLGSGDTAVMEVSTETFYWADHVGAGNTPDSKAIEADRSTCAGFPLTAQVKAGENISDTTGLPIGIYDSLIMIFNNHFYYWWTCGE